MAALSRIVPASNAGWPDLVDEFDRWQEVGRVAALWWRDDDAVAASFALDRLIAIAGAVPVALAVIPGMVQPELAMWFSRSSAGSALGPRVAVLQHGWRHSNHSPDAKKSEFPAARRATEVAAELAAGRARLRELFSMRALPVLVPPWNRFDDCFLPLLLGCGMYAISRTSPRRRSWPVPGVFEANIHVDLVAWAGDRGFVGEATALGGLIAHLRARRLGMAAADEPTGILTHHLVQDETVETFLLQLFDVTGAHDAARWLHATEVFAPAMPVAQ